MPCRRRHLASLAALLAGTLSTVAAMAGERCRIIDPTSGVRWHGGDGALVWSDGRSYTGTLRGGRPDGYGTHVWPDGTRYTGEWSNGACDGAGTLFYPDGRRYVGRFRLGKATGDGEFISATGTRYSARITPDGTILPGAMLGPRAPRTAALPATLDEWLRGP